jgi:hypothetical protein
MLELGYRSAWMHAGLVGLIFHVAVESLIYQGLLW